MQTRKSPWQQLKSGSERNTILVFEDERLWVLFFFQLPKMIADNRSQGPVLVEIVGGRHGYGSNVFGFTST